MNRLLFILLLTASFIFAAETVKTTDASAQKNTESKTEVKVEAKEAKAEAPKTEVKAEAKEAKAEAPKTEVKAEAKEAKAEAPKTEVKAEAKEAKAEAPKTEVKAEAKEAKTDAPKKEVKAEAKETKTEAPKKEVKAEAKETKADAPKKEVKAEAKEAKADAPKKEVKAEAKETKAEAELEDTQDVLDSELASSEASASTTKEKIQVKFGSNFEIQAGKVFWSSEDDLNGHNLEEWFGRANLSLLTKTDRFIGKLFFSVYPGDLVVNPTYVYTEDKNTELEYRDILELREASALQRTKYFNFKLGRWENTDKHGDYFGGYIDGYKIGFKSTQKAENMMQFGFTPSENLALEFAFISTGPYLNTGDFRGLAQFRDLPSLEAIEVDLAFRTNIFDKVYSSKSDVKTNVSLKAKLNLIDDKLALFGEVAMLDLGSDSTETYIDEKGYKHSRTVVVDWKMPLTGGILFTPGVIDKIVLEAEYLADRHETVYKTNSKKIKDVLGAFYIEKSLTDRFTLSAGFHSYGSSRDFVLNGNLIGRIY